MPNVLRQSMAGRVIDSCEGASAGKESVFAAVILRSLLGRIAKLSCDETPDGSLLAPRPCEDSSRGMMLRELSHAQSLSTPLQDGLRLLHLPLPAGLSACLAVRLPRGRLPQGRTTGLPRSA